MSDGNSLLTLNGVSKSFDTAGGAAEVFRDVNLNVDTGESLAIIGPSGCGKSTLLNLVGALDEPTSGTLNFEGRAIHDRNENELAEFRNTSVGFVFQLHHLLPQCTALENVLVPTLVNRAGGDARPRATKLLERVGLGDRMNYRPGLLSGGERQRVAVVRALINQPKLLLADEPTGSLSEEGAGALADLLIELNREEGMALIVVTHSIAVAKTMGRIMEFHDGGLREYAAT